MTKPEILEEKPITMAEVQEHLESLKKRTNVLNFRAERTDEYLSQFVSLPGKKSAELKTKLEKLEIPRLKEEHIVKIVDLVPTTPEEVKTLLSGYTITITNDNMKKIAATVKEYLEK